MYLAINSRPDILYAIIALSRQNKDPSYLACKAAVHVLTYLASTLERGLIFPKRSNEGLVVYSDADWAGDNDTSKSTSGYIVYLWGAPIAWQSRLQPTVATSSVESEYMAAYAATQEVIWVRGFLSELGFEEFNLSTQQSPTTLWMDSKSAINMAENPVQHKRTKHIRVKYHWLREQVNAAVIKMKYIPTKEMKADILTKGLDASLYTQHLNGLTSIVH